jgi:DNA-directed RNA polymerase beta subunit
LLNIKIPNFIKANNPIKLILGDERTISIYIGGKDNVINYLPPTDETSAKLPHTCRLNNETYSLEIRVDIDIEYLIDNKTEVKSFNDILLGKIPLMLKSQLCYLSMMSSDQLLEAGECKFELGGYFIIGGSEKALLVQERLGDNMFYASKRPQVASSSKVRTVGDDDEKSKLEDITKGEKFEYVAGVKSVSEDGSKGPYSHFLVIPPKNIQPNDPKGNDYSIYSIGRLAVITLPGFLEPVPLISVFYALGCTNDQDIYDTIFCGTPDSDRTRYDDIFSELILSHERFIEQEMRKETVQQDPNLLFLTRQTRSRSKGPVYVNLFDMFPHCEYRGESPPAFFRRKAYLLGKLTRIAIDVANETKPKTDRDHLRFKRLYASGDLIFREFVDSYKEVSKRMLTELDTRVHFEAQA